MKKEYKDPELKVSLFITDVCTEVSGTGSNGVDIVGQGLGEKNINNVEKVNLSAFDFFGSTE